MKCKRKNKKKMKQKKIKREYVDDGHTIYNMDVDGMSQKKKKEQ